jgi:hypothetical protein
MPSVADSLRKTCRYHGLGHTDAAKRLCDGVRSAMGRISVEELLIGRWIAFRLSDGSADRSIYDTKRDAVRHQSDEFLCGYIKLNLMPMTECEAEVVLAMHRKLYDNGFRMPDPDRKDGGKQPIMPIARERRLALAEFDRYA